VSVTITIEIVGSGACLLRQTINVDHPDELRYCEETKAREGFARENNSDRLRDVRQRLASFVMSIGTLAAVLLAATAVLSALSIAPNAPALKAIAALILMSAIRAAGHIAGSAKGAK